MVAGLRQCLRWPVVDQRSNLKPGTTPSMVNKGDYERSAYLRNNEAAQFIAPSASFQSE
jgi:hypothetical protein